MKTSLANLFASPPSSSRSSSSASCSTSTRGRTWSTSWWWCCWWLCWVRNKAVWLRGFWMEAFRVATGCFVAFYHFSVGGEQSKVKPDTTLSTLVGIAMKENSHKEEKVALPSRDEGIDGLCSAAASLTVISVKAVSGMITESIKGHLQLIYPIFYIMLVVMIASCAFQIKSVHVFFTPVLCWLSFFSLSCSLQTWMVFFGFFFFAVLVLWRNEGEKKKYSKLLFHCCTCSHSENQGHFICGGFDFLFFLLTDFSIRRWRCLMPQKWFPSTLCFSLRVPSLQVGASKRATVDF